MDISDAEPPTDTPAAPIRRRRPLHKRAVHLLRRGHLYCGLFLLPWVLLYGVTAFLFNHPTAFADQPTAEFGREALHGTPMELPPSPAEVAAAVVAGLNAKADGRVYALTQPEKARYVREAAFATVKGDGFEANVLVYANGSGGTVRRRAVAPPKVEETAPFVTAKGGRPKGDRPAPKADAARADGLNLPEPLYERVKAAVPAVLNRIGFPAGEVTVTSVPDVQFVVSDGAREWRTTYNPLTGALTGKPNEAADPSPLSARSFLLRLHTAHGYPGEVNGRWVWAVIVDVMAFVMVFWAVSGLLMWWQIKATRRWGLVALVLSAGVAVWLGVGMYDLMTNR